MKFIIQNRFVQIGLAFLIGGLAAHLFTKRQVRIEEKEVIVTQIQIVEVEKEVRVIETVDRTRVVSPDGTVTEREVKKREEEARERSAEEKKADAIELARTEVRDLNNNTLFYGGVGVNTDLRPVYALGVSTPLWGPFQVGIQFAGNQDSVGVYGTLGLSF